MSIERWTFQNRVYPARDELMPLLKFYLFETPVRGVSKRGKDFSDLGWSGPAFNTLKAGMRKSSQLTNERWVQVKSSADLMRLLKREHLFDSVTFAHECAYYVEGRKKKIEGLFYLIRNAFAHGSFFRRSIRGNAYYVFENRATRDNSLRGRAIISEATLLNWKKLVLHPDKRLL